jgi:hypothetical protein
MSIPDECYSRNGYPGNSGDHKTSIMSIPDEYYSRNGYPGNSGDTITWVTVSRIIFIRYVQY